MQLEVFWSLFLQADSDGPNPHLLCSFVAHYLQYILIFETDSEPVISFFKHKSISEDLPFLHFCKKYDICTKN
jgi:hypothetical protein